MLIVRGLYLISKPIFLSPMHIDRIQENNRGTRRGTSQTVGGSGPPRARARCPFDFEMAAPNLDRHHRGCVTGAQRERHAPKRRTSQGVAVRCRSSRALALSRKMNRYADENVPAQSVSRTPIVKGILKQSRYSGKATAVLFGGKDSLSGSAAGRRTPLGLKTNKLHG